MVPLELHQNILIFIEVFLQAVKASKW